MAIILKFHDDTDVKFHDDDLFELHEPVVAVGGASGGRSTQKGVSIFEQDRSLGPRPTRKISSEGIGRIKIESKLESISKIQISSRALSESIIKPFTVLGVSLGQIQLKSKAESYAKIKHKIHTEAVSFVFSVRNFNDKMRQNEKIRKIVKLMALFQQAEAVDDTFQPSKKYTFSFQEQTGDEALKSFTHSSSFVGNVQYDPDSQGMKIILNGKTYNFCNVPERVFDAFEGSSSKGAFFARNIKQQYDC